MNIKHPDLFPETLLVSREGDLVFTTSLKVAAHFQKRHTEVLRKIRNFGCSETFRQRNFASATYLDDQKKPREMFSITHDGFAFLAMGFTGKVAVKWKEDFLDAFRAMEEQIAAFRAREANALYGLRPKWKLIIQNPGLDRLRLIDLTGHKSAGSITACRRRMRQIGLLDS